jgi:molybdate transport repressor ModE-like protein
MRLSITFDGRIALGDVAMPAEETLAILDGIARTATLKGAAERTGLSYRAIWGKLARLEAALGRPLALRTKGHGTRLSPTGERLRDALSEMAQRLAPALEAESRTLGAALAELVAVAAPRPLVLAASHDPLLAAASRDVPGLRLDIVGSSEAVAALRAGRADLAGCHFASLDESPPAALAQALRAEGFVWRVLFRRAQGLMVAPGNPLGIAGVADLPRLRTRFVNRQPGSGTRLWFDRLLKRHKIAPAAIIGYGDEEFTHQAVAAVIASGRADAGLGAHSAAARFGLDFLPLGEEVYFLVTSQKCNEDRRVPELSARIADIRANFSGYYQASGR